MKPQSLSVLFFSHSAQLAGAERSLLELVEQLIADHGAVCTVVLPSEGPLKTRLEAAGAATLVIDYQWWCDPDLLPPEEARRRLSNSFKNVLSRLPELGKVNPDVVFTSTLVIPWGAVAASFLGRPHIWSIREFGELDHNLKFYLPFPDVLNVIKAPSNLILTNSHAVKQALFGEAPPENVLTIYPHIDIPAEALQGDEPDYFTRPQATRLIIFGTVIETKGHKDAILAVRELVRRKQDVELVIMGYADQTYLAQLKELVSAEGLEPYVKFVDFRENPYPAVKQADIVLVCSRHEALGRVTIEAMLLGKPVIGTNIGGTLELVKEGFNGLLYAPGDYIQLSGKIAYLIEHKAKIKEFGENGYKFARENFTREKSGDTIARLLHEIKGKSNPSTNDFARFTSQAMLATLFDFTTALEDRDSRIAVLNNTLQVKNAQIAELNYSLNKMECNLSENGNQITNLQRDFNAIRYSLTWQAAKKLHKVIDKLIPLGTKRRLLAKLVSLGIIRPKLLFANLNKANISKFFHYLWNADAVMLNKMVNNTLQISSPLTTSKLIDGVPNPDEKISLDEVEELIFQLPTQPVVSIIIPAYNKWQYTYRCLQSIYKNTPDIIYEIIVVNDCSTDETLEMLNKMEGIIVITNKTNLGFLRNCNNAAQHARGEYILFLNNDTYVMKDWLQSLLLTAEQDNKIGIIGPNLISPYGILMENGWIIDVDGWGLPIGRGKDPDNYEFNYLKEVDCVTGACFLIRKDVFIEAGSFDETFSPAFYEEFDLAFSVRQMGYKVVIQPKTRVVHYGTTSYADDTRNKLSIINHEKFMEKWKLVLQASLKQPQNYFLARDRSQKKKIMLIIDDKVPDYDKYAGSQTMYQYVMLFKELDFKVIFLPDNFKKYEPYTAELQQKGIEVIYGQFDFDTWLNNNGKYIDIVWLTRPTISIKYIEGLRRETNARILYYTSDLHYLREQRRYEIEKKESILIESERLKDIEFSLFRSADVILTPSNAEKDIILEEFSTKHIEVIPPYLYDDFPFKPAFGFDSRRSIIFVGGFGHSPNVDAILWFVGEIFPYILLQVPDIQFFIVGSDPPQSIRDLASYNIIVTGYVKDLTPYFEKARVFVAPLRYGAGIKGKIITSMYYGVPCVTTTIGSEGMGISDGEDVLIADDPKEFAEKVIKLYTTKKLWEKLANNCNKFVNNKFTRVVAQQKILGILSKISKFQ